MNKAINKRPVVTEEMALHFVFLYCEQKKSIPDISKESDVALSTVRRNLVKYGVALRTRIDGHSLARGKMGKHLIGVKRNFTKEHKENIRKAKLYNFESVSLKPSGYLEITTLENKGSSAHVVVMEAFLGRSVRANEIVHHIDHDKTNNDIDNLALLTRSGHSRLHRLEDSLAGYKPFNVSKNKE